MGHVAGVRGLAAAVTPMFETHRFAAFPPVLLTMILVPVAGAIVAMLPCRAADPSTPRSSATSRR